jgi:hypothetical protein
MHDFTKKNLRKMEIDEIFSTQFLKKNIYEK